MSEFTNIYIDEFEFETFKYTRVTDDKGETICCRRRNIFTYFEEKIDINDFINIKIRYNSQLRKISLIKNKEMKNYNQLLK